MMEFKDLKKIVAGFAITALLSGTALNFTSCKTTEYSKKEEEKPRSSELEVKRKFPHGGPTGHA
jgi:hypothetical protein